MQLLLMGEREERYKDAFQVLRTIVKRSPEDEKKLAIYEKDLEGNPHKNCFNTNPRILFKFVIFFCKKQHVCNAACFINQCRVFERQYLYNSSYATKPQMTLWVVVLLKFLVSCFAYMLWKHPSFTTTPTANKVRLFFDIVFLYLLEARTLVNKHKAEMSFFKSNILELETNLTKKVYVLTLRLLI